MEYQVPEEGLIFQDDNGVKVQDISIGVKVKVIRGDEMKTNLQQKESLER